MPLDADLWRVKTGNYSTILALRGIFWRSCFSAVDVVRSIAVQDVVERAPMEETWEGLPQDRNWDRNSLGTATAGYTSPTGIPMTLC